MEMKNAWRRLQSRTGPRVTQSGAWDEACHYAMRQRAVPDTAARALSIRSVPKPGPRLCHPTQTRIPCPEARGTR